MGDKLVGTAKDTDQASEPDKKRVIAYWVTTGLLGLAIGGGGAVDISQAPEVLATIDRLGYPHYFIVMLGVAKVLGALTLLAPRLPRLKEWAYAGVVIDLVSAAVSHMAVGDPLQNVVPPVGLLVVAIASHQLRPASRQLAG